MTESPDQTPDAEAPRAVATNEIARSLGTVWQRFSGARPKSTSVEIGRDVVECVIEEGTPDATDDADDAATEGVALSPDSSGFQHDASAAVTRATGRRVAAFIPKRDKKNRTSKQTFILDRPIQRF